MRYDHRFVVDSSLESVRDFHRRTASMADITPPPAIVQMHGGPDEVAEGAVMRFTLWFGPLPVRWAAQFTHVTPTGFLDTQIDGPFTRWEHQHSFLPIGASRTEILDSVTWEPGAGWWKYLISLGMALSLPVLFTYRARKTRRILDRKSLSEKQRASPVSQ